jgi:cardiolipin synthase
MSYIASIYAVIFAIVEAFGIFTAIHAVLFIRSSQGAIAWSIVLILFPWAGLPLYWVFGRNKFRGYIEALRSGNMLSNNLLGRTLQEMKKFSVPLSGSVFEKNTEADVFSYLSGYPFTYKNYAELLVNGKNTFDAIFSYIKNAKDYVLLEFFIIRNDKTGQRLKDLLKKKAAQGVRIYFLYDEIGCRKTDDSFFKSLEAAGVEIKPFFTTRGRRNRFQLNFRNHRKIVVIDGKYGFVGGHNIGDEYVERTKKYKDWRDTHMFIEGPSVLGIQLTFLSDWYWAVRKNIELSWTAYESKRGDVQAIPFPTDPSHNLDTCLLFFLNSIMSAKKRVWIASPYFVPDDSIIEALQIAALRGVDVKIILPGVPDKKIVYLASFAYFSRLFMPGIKIYRYTPGFMHQKVMLIDDDWSAVGSANLDNRSFYLNFEMNMLIRDYDFNEKVEAMLEDDIMKSDLILYPDIHKNNIFFRLAVRLASLFSPIL